MFVVLRALLISALALLPAIAQSQGLNVAFGQLQQDTALPVEVTADSLSVNQTDGSAVFKGNVRISQGTMSLSADKVNVFYKTDSTGIARLVAEGNVLLVQGEDVAESQTATYDIDNGTVHMTGGVTVVQGINTIIAQEMRIDLQANTAEMHGGVKTILRTE